MFRVTSLALMIAAVSMKTTPFVGAQFPQFSLPNYNYFPLAAQPFLKKRNFSIKIKFTPEEDQKLLQLVAEHGAKDWIKIASLIGTRNARQCRERYKNYINPSLRKDNWTKEEDELLLEKYQQYGGKWNKISKFFVNRSDNHLRNRWMMLARHQAKGLNDVANFSPVESPIAENSLSNTTKSTVSINNNNNININTKNTNDNETDHQVEEFLPLNFLSEDAFYFDSNDFSDPISFGNYQNEVDNYFY